MKKITDSVAAAHRCSVPLVAIETPDPAATMRQIVDNVSIDTPKACWNVVDGFQKLNEAGDEIMRVTGGCQGNVLEALKKIHAAPEESIVFVMMGDRWMTAPPVIQAIWNLRDEFKTNGRMLVLLCTDAGSMPAELKHDVVIFSEPLPDDEHLGQVLDDLCATAGVGGEKLEVSEEVRERVIDAVRGLSAFEAEQVIAMSIRKDGVSVSDCQERKRKMVEQTKGLSVFTESHSFNDLAGLEQVKKYLTGLMNGPMRPKAVVWLDEIEKSGLAHTSDLSGVNSDSLGTVLSYMEDHKVFGVMLVGVPGCQPKGQVVLMADGSFKDVSEIKVGDIVVSPLRSGLSTHAQVVSTVQYKNKPIYRITDKKGRSYRCSNDHVVPHICTRTESLEEAIAGGRNHESRLRVFELTEATASQIGDYGKVKSDRWKIFSAPACEFRGTPLPVHPYVLGVLLGDGCLTKRSIRVTCPDREVLERLVAHGVQIGKVAGKPGCIEYGIVGESLIEIRANIEAMGLNVLSKHKHIPVCYLHSNLESRLQLLAGLIDTDGTCREFSSASKAMADGFAFLVRSVGGIANVISVMATCSGKEFPAYRVQFSFAEITPPISVPRKIPNTRDIDWKNPRNSGASIEFDGVEDVYGFTINSSSQWYVTNDWLVTHNCGKSELCKAMAAEFDTIVIRMDMGAMQGSLVGESQQNLRAALKTVDAICGENALFIATSNSIEGLDSALKSRFTDTFFFDLPSDEQRAQAWDVHKRKFGIDDDEMPNDEGWSGRNIQRCCQKAYSLGMRLVDAATFVIPEAIQSKEVVDMLRRQATGKYLSSDYPGAYSTECVGGTKGRRMAAK